MISQMVIHLELMMGSTWANTWHYSRVDDGDMDGSGVHIEQATGQKIEILGILHKLVSTSSQATKFPSRSSLYQIFPLEFWQHIPQWKVIYLHGIKQCYFKRLSDDLICFITMKIIHFVWVFLQVK